MTAGKTTAGLRGQSAGETAIATVGKEGAGLTYRGYDIVELAEKATFEEVAYLLMYEELPSRATLEAYKARLKGLRALPAALTEALERIPPEAQPMDVLRTGCGMLGTLEPERDFSQQHDIADRLLVALPSMLLYWHHYATNGVRIDTDTDDDTVGGHFLDLLHRKAPSASHRQAMDTALILYAEHELNASTFAARVCTATLSDFYSAITAAIGTLRGPLHGGANEAAMALVERFADPDQADAGIREMLARKDKIMGFGHAIYRDSDPRNAVIKAIARRLCDECGNTSLFEVAEAIEQRMWADKKLFANLDFYSASAFRCLSIPTPLFTPIFAISRLTGWAAHIMEQRANNRLIRPSADYVGPEPRPYVPIDQRG